MSYLLKFFICGILSSFLFPPFFLFPVGFITFPYLFFLISNIKIINSSKFRQFLYGTIYGLGLNLILLNWIKEPFLVNLSSINFSSFSYLLIIYVSIYFGFAFLILSFFKNKFSKLILIPVIFVSMEIIREHFIFGFPWVTFALLASANYYILNIAYYIGTYGLSCLILFLLLIPAVIMLIIEKRSIILSKIYLWVFVIIFLIFSSLIFLRINYFENNYENQEINISLNQLNVHHFNNSDELLKEKQLIEIFQAIKNKKNHIFIFSETDYPFIIKNEDIVNIFQDILSNNNALIIGGIRKDNKGYYNSMYYISNNSYTFFDKKILVPFGEFLPLREYLSFLDVIVGNIDFNIGEKNRIINVSQNLNLIPVICYEIIFFNKLLNKTNSKSPLLVNLTNDSWFGEFSGPYQHFYLSRIRSVEFNKYIIRVSNNGVSAVINNLGKIKGFIPLNSKGHYNTKIYIPKSSNNIFNYHKYFYLIIIFVFAFAIIIERKIEPFNS